MSTQIKLCDVCGYSFKPVFNDLEFCELFISEKKYALYEEQDALDKLDYPTQKVCSNCMKDFMEMDRFGLDQKYVETGTISRSQGIKYTDYQGRILIIINNKNI